MRTDPFVQQRGLQTVAVLCFDKPEMKQQAVAAGAVEAIVLAMRKHRARPLARAQAMRPAPPLLCYVL